jgi:hypothetical protein
MTQKHMSTLTAAVGLLAMLAAPAFGQQPQPQTAEPVGSKLPRIAVSAESFDFGRVPQGASISHIFWIKNVGEDTLRITDIKPG